MDTLKIRHRIYEMQYLARIIRERFERLGAFVSKTVGAGRLDHTKNAAEANDRARRPKKLGTRPTDRRRALERKGPALLDGT